jgi:hypothetical protein
MKDDEVKQAFGVESAKEVRLSRDGVVGKVNNFIHDLANTATITPACWTRLSLSNFSPRIGIIAGLRTF